MIIEHAIAATLKAHRRVPEDALSANIRGMCAECRNGPWTEEHAADEIRKALASDRWAVVKMPTVAFKGTRDTDQSMLRTAADKAESARYPVGGSNVGRAVGQVLRAVADEMYLAGTHISAPGVDGENHDAPTTTTK